MAAAGGSAGVMLLRVASCLRVVSPPKHRGDSVCTICAYVPLKVIQYILSKLISDDVSVAELHKTREVGHFAANTG